MKYSTRVLILIDSFELGGAEKQAVLLARELRRGFSVAAEVWALRGPCRGPVVDLCVIEGVRCRSVGYRWDTRLRDRLSRWKLILHFRAFRPDYLISYTVTPNVFCGQLWPRSGARAHVWGQVDEGRNRPVERLRRAAAGTPKFTANSEAGARFLHEILGVPSDRIRVIPNGVYALPPRATAAEWRRRLGIEADTPLVAMTATLSHFKDHGTLLRAWRRVLDGVRPGERTPVLVLAGRHGETAPALLALARDLALGDSVRFLGYVPDVSGLLGAVDLAVHVSNSEGMPNAVLEAMFAGLPVVATDIPAHRALLPESGRDLLHPPGDDGSLAERIGDLLRSPERRRALGAENRRAAEPYSPTELARRTVEFLQA